jgi:hypothetical protein
MKVELDDRSLATSSPLPPARDERRYQSSSEGPSLKSSGIGLSVPSNPSRLVSRAVEERASDRGGEGTESYRPTAGAKAKSESPLRGGASDSTRARVSRICSLRLRSASDLNWGVSTLLLSGPIETRRDITAQLRAEEPSPARHTCRPICGQSRRCTLAYGHRSRSCALDRDCMPGESCGGDGLGSLFQ